MSKNLLCLFGLYCRLSFNVSKNNSIISLLISPFLLMGGWVSTFNYNHNIIWIFPGLLRPCHRLIFLLDHYTSPIPHFPLFCYYCLAINMHWELYLPSSALSQGRIHPYWAQKPGLLIYNFVTIPGLFQQYPFLVLKTSSLCRNWQVNPLKTIHPFSLMGLIPIFG